MLATAPTANSTRTSRRRSARSRVPSHGRVTERETTSPPHQPRHHQLSQPMLSIQTHLRLVKHVSHPFRHLHPPHTAQVLLQLLLPHTNHSQLRIRGAKRNVCNGR